MREEAAQQEFMRMPIDRRSTPRLAVLGRLHGHLVSLDVPITIGNLGLGGFSAESVMPFPLGARHQFRFTTDTGGEVNIQAVVVHRRPGYSADGLTFFVTGFAFVHDPAHDTAGDIRLLLASMTPDANDVPAVGATDQADHPHAQGAIRLVAPAPGRATAPPARRRRRLADQPA
jgi:hypothetical protein